MDFLYLRERWLFGVIFSPDCSGYPTASLKGERGVIAENGKQLQITKNYCNGYRMLYFSEVKLSFFNPC